MKIASRRAIHCEAKTSQCQDDHVSAYTHPISELNKHNDCKISKSTTRKKKVEEFELCTGHLKRHLASEYPWMYFVTEISNHDECIRITLNKFHKASLDQRFIGESNREHSLAMEWVRESHRCLRRDEEPQRNEETQGRP